MNPDASKTSPCAAWLLNGNEQYGVGGPALTLARGMAERGWRTHFFLLCEGPFEEQCRRAGFGTTILGGLAPRLESRRWWNIPRTLVAQRDFERRVAPQLAEGLRKIGAHHLSVRWPPHVGTAGKAARLAGIPCFWLMPNIVSGRWPLALDRWWYCRMCRELHIRPLPNSQYTGESLGGDLGQQVLYLGVDHERFDPERVRPYERAALELPKTACVLGVFARLHRNKGQQLLWQAMLSEVERGADLHLLLVGGPSDGPAAAEMRAAATRQGAMHRLHFAGATKEPERYYGAIDVAVNARIDPEPFGLSVIEAMFMKKPVLVHALGGPAETVVDGVTGWHMKPATPEAYAAGIRRALSDRERWHIMGEAAREHALKRFTVKQFVDNYLRLVE